MNTGTFILVIALVATSVIVANHIITKKNVENQRIQNAAFIAAQRAELKKKEEEIVKKKEKELEDRKQNEVKISSWETLNTKPPEILNRAQEELLQSNPPQSRPETINVKHVDKLWAAEQTEDDVNLAENLFSIVKDETDEEESLYSYKNLTHAHTLSRREMLPVRDAWSRADNTNPALWESQVQFMRDEIKASGQTLEEFRENTLMPLPEQFTALWKSAEEEPVKKSKDLSIPKPPPKHAVAEAASLVRDATQYVHFENSDLASQSMIEIAKAIKRSSALGVTLPSLPQSTADAVKKWSESDDELAKQAALALVNII
jgi:hypothetical protein